MLHLLLRNKHLDVNSIEPFSNVTAFWMACLYGHGKIMSILAESGANIYVTNRCLVNPLHLAIYCNHIEIVSMLVKSNYELKHETEDGMTAIQIAASLGRYEIASFIIKFLTETSFKKSYVDEIINKINA